MPLVTLFNDNYYAGRDNQVLVVEGQQMVSSGRTWGNAGVPGIYVVLLYDLLVALKLDAPTLLVGLGVSRDELLAVDRRVSMSLAQTVAERGVEMVGQRSGCPRCGLPVSRPARPVSGNSSGSPCGAGPSSITQHTPVRGGP